MFCFIVERSLAKANNIRSTTHKRTTDLLSDQLLNGSLYFVDLKRFAQNDIDVFVRFAHFGVAGEQDDGHGGKAPAEQLGQIAPSEP